MKIVDLKCPNCSGNLKKEGDLLVCDSCGATFAMDYDESDVEYERLQGEAEREERQHAHEKELLEKKFELQRQAQIESERRQLQKKRADDLSSSIKGFVILGVVLVIIGSVIFTMFKIQQSLSMEDALSAETVTPTPAPNYNITPEDVADSMADFIDTGRIAQMNIVQCCWRNANGIPKYFQKTDAVFLEAYIVSGIPDVRDSQSTRLVLIYQVTWHHDELGDQICYDGVYFDGIRVNPNGGIITDFSAHTIWRSDAAWGWAEAYSFEDRNQCYRENVASLGGTVTPVPVDGSSVGESAVDESI